jgi:hypothetical protein
MTFGQRTGDFTAKNGVGPPLTAAYDPGALIIQVEPPAPPPGNSPNPPPGGGTGPSNPAGSKPSVPGAGTPPAGAVGTPGAARPAAAPPAPPAAAGSATPEGAKPLPPDEAGDDLFAALVARAPEFDLRSEQESLSASDIAAALLVGARARADILPQRGSPVAVVATLLGGDDEGTPPAAAAGEEVLKDLLMSPASGGPPPEAAGPTPGPEEVPGVGADEPPPGTGRRLVRLVVAVVAGCLGVAAGTRYRTWPGRRRPTVGLPRPGESRGD